MPKATLTEKILLQTFFGAGGAEPNLKDQLGKDSSVDIGRTDDNGNFIPKPKFDTITKPNA